jgi:hypothetical protein
MKDALETYIEEHKASLDVFEPSDRIWEAIDREMEVGGRKRILQAGWAWKMAAAVLLLVALGLGFWRVQPVREPLAAAQGTHQHYSPELIEVENYYTSLIDGQVARVRQFQQEGVVADDELFGALDQLRNMYQELQTELQNAENQELVVNAMVQNLSMQMEILNQQLLILEQVKSFQDEAPQSL